MTPHAKPPGSHGLVLGKFAPLHRGHQLLIETAIAEVERVTVLVYDAPEVTAVPLEIRAGWIRELYPCVSVRLGWAGPSEVGEEARIMRMQEDYVIKTLGLSDVTHFYSSEFYGEHMSKALGAVDRRIDEARSRVPVSGTRIRDDFFGHRCFLHPVVYRDLVTRVVLLGAPSTGKTTLSAALASHYQTVWMPEYGREYWEENQVNRRLSPEQLVEIAEGHLEREELLVADARTYLFIDTNALTTLIFARQYHGEASTRLQLLADEAPLRYDIVILCGDDIPYDDTTDRSGDFHRRVTQRQTEDELTRRRIPFLRVAGSVEERMASVSALLARHEKWRNPALLWRESTQ